MGNSSWRLLVMQVIIIGMLSTRTDAQSHTSAELRHAIKLMPYVHQLAARMLNATVKAEASQARFIRFAGRRPSTAFKAVQNFLGATEQAKQMSYGAEIQIEALKILKQRMGMGKEKFERLLKKLPTLLRSNSYTVNTDDPKYVPLMDVCPYPRRTKCNKKASFRSFDGCCNNPKKTLWGAAFQPLLRLLPPDYADGIDEPRQSKYGSPLPTARAVSWRMHKDQDNPSSTMSLMVMLLGQFLDHDISRTAISKLSDEEGGFGGIEDVMCGEDGCATGDGELKNCMPISVPDNDPLFKTKRCLMFVRTLPVPDSECTVGPRQQLNQITSYLDASHIYGSTRRQADALRDLTDPRRGRLRMRQHPTNRFLKPLLPPWELFSNSELCRGANSTVKCFLAGDGRVNENLALSCLHTSFAREHNRIEEELHRINPHWDGNRLYFETRRILGAMWQHIIYEEYLKVVLGPQILKYYGLELENYGYYRGYDPDIRSDAANAFATAAFRFGHSQIQGMIHMKSEDYRTIRSIPLSSIFRNPAPIYEGEHSTGDEVIRGMVGDQAQVVDPNLSEEIVGKLFSKNPPFDLGTDLAALNVQRGREHGLPGYANWREWCGLGRPRTFADLTDLMPTTVANQLKNIYSEVDDIDLFPAGVSEYHVQGSLMGPTFACIIANQFQRLRRGDRFWYENKDNPYPFSIAQLREIRKASLSKVLCTNGDNMGRIQPRALLLPFREAYRTLWATGNIDKLPRIYSIYNGAWNDRTECIQLPTMDFTAWREYSRQASKPAPTYGDIYHPQSPTYSPPYTVYAIIRNLKRR